MIARLFQFHNPRDYTFARAARRGTWYPEQSPGLCPECGSIRQRIISPLVIEWLPDSDLIGDFTWASFDEYIVVTERVRQSFEARFSGIAFGPVAMVQDVKLKPQRLGGRRLKPRVWLPYRGPTLWHLQPVTKAALDLKRSGYSIRRVCSTCGTVFYDTPSPEQQHLVVDRLSWSGASVFFIGDSAGAVYCTEEVKRFVDNAGFTNVALVEVGVIPGQKSV